MTSSHADPARFWDTEARDAAAASLLVDEELVLALLARDGTILDVNAGFRRLLGDPGVTLWEHVPDDVRGLDSLGSWVRAGAGVQRIVNVRSVTGVSMRTLRATPARVDQERVLLRGVEVVEDTADYAAELSRVTNELAVLARENRRRSRELQDALRERDEAFWHVRRMQEVLPFCMRCGDVKDEEEADWRPLAEYLQRNASFLSHGYCPGCMDATLHELGLEAPGAE